jgi:hypothetical protein
VKDTIASASQPDLSACSRLQIVQGQNKPFKEGNFVELLADEAPNPSCKQFDLFIAHGIRRLA